MGGIIGIRWSWCMKEGWRKTGGMSEVGQAHRTGAEGYLGRLGCFEVSQDERESKRELGEQTKGRGGRVR